MPSVIYRLRNKKADLINVNGKFRGLLRLTECSQHSSVVWVRLRKS